MSCRLLYPALLLAAGVVAIGCGASDTELELTNGTGEAGPPDAGVDDAASEADAPADSPVEAKPDAEGGGGSLCPPDEDGDNIPDDVEGKAELRDTDGDGIADYLDLDSDGDTIPDLIEGDTASVGCLTPLDSDGDGIPDYLDTDSDNNGVPDRDEIYPDGGAYDPSVPLADTDGDGRPDYVDRDNDGDGLDDVTELGGQPSQDTDGDGLDDIFDPDSDGDGILDGHEGTADTDGDGVPNFRDLDSDGDGVSDACEAGPGHTLWQLPADTDQDGKYDFLDLDSDRDGLTDKQEDKDGNCKLDPGETDRIIADTDGDGANDMIEVTLGSDPNDEYETPESLGKFYFTVPYEQPPVPEEHTLPVKTNLSKADVAFVVDTTGSMAQEIDVLRTGLQQVILTLLQDIPELAVGIAGFDDYPVDPYGDPAQAPLPFYVPGGAAGRISTSSADAVAAVSQLTIHGGGDEPESAVAALWRSLTAGQMSWPGQYVPPESPPAGRYGSLHFRQDAFPIIALVTDAPMHNGRSYKEPQTLRYPYSFNDVHSVPTVDDLVTAIKDKGARFLGFASNNGVRDGDPYDDMAFITDSTQSFIPPSAFGGSSCLTGLGGIPIAGTDGPQATCRLIFDIWQDGTGLNARIVAAIQALLKGLKLDIRVQAVSDPVVPPLYIDTVDDFISHVIVSQNGGIDPTEPGSNCITVNSSDLADKWSGPKGHLAGGDTYNETVLGVVPTTKICFKVFPKQNNVAPELREQPQVFRAWLQVKAKKSNAVEINLGTPSEVIFVVPPPPQ